MGFAPHVPLGVHLREVVGVEPHARCDPGREKNDIGFR